ncbi:MAG: 3-dehydroquinate synthase [Rhodothalassiaceae bacterium]
MSDTVVRVGLEGRDYEIVIAPGVLHRAGAVLADHLPRQRLTVVADTAVVAQHGKALTQSLQASGIAVTMIEMDAGEASKSFAKVDHLCRQLLDAQVERGDWIAAMGGGVVGDLVGFVAAILRRGVSFVQIPTTLLAQVDSSVGGKTGINMPQGKNLVGAFHQPRLVLIDPDTLATLPLRERRAGYAEIVKYGLIDQPSFFEWLCLNGTEVLNGDADALVHAIATSCEAKARVVAADEREAGQRALLNLGHTFGHAVEALAGYDGRVLHGEAVALGLAMACRFSVRQGLMAPEDAARVVDHLDSMGLPIRCNKLPVKVSAEPMLRAMMQDKKVSDGQMTLILLRGIGQAFIAPAVNLHAVTAFLRDETS